MSKTLKKLTVLLVVTLAVLGGIFGGLSAAVSAQTSDEEALKAEVAIASSEFVRALSTGDGELFDSLWLQSDNASYISSAQPFRIEGWSDVRQAYNGLLSLPPGSVSLNARQLRIDMLGDDAAIVSSHFVLSIRPPGGSRRTINGRATGVLQKVDGKWLRVHLHASVLP